MYVCLSTAPRLQSLSAEPLSNGTLLVEWAVLYTGGSDKIQLDVVIQYGTAGNENQGAMDSIFMSFDPIATSQFVSPVLASARQYTITSHISNEYGSTQQMTYGLFIAKSCIP